MRLIAAVVAAGIFIGHSLGATSGDLAALKGERDALIENLFADQEIADSVRDTWLQQDLDAAYCAGILDAAALVRSKTKAEGLAYRRIGDDVLEDGQWRSNARGAQAIRMTLRILELQRLVSATEWESRPSEAVHREAVLCAFSQEEMPRFSLRIGADIERARYDLLFAAAVSILFGVSEDQ